MIFCGGVVPNRFRPAAYPDRLQWPLLNEVGTRDIWPVVAESVSWGYGATGARGLQHPQSYDRYHYGVDHSAFLTAQFCRDNWVPFLRGEYPKPAQAPRPPSWWLDLLLTFKIKWVVLVAACLYFYMDRFGMPSELAFLGTLTDLDVGWWFGH